MPFFKVTTYHEQVTLAVTHLVEAESADAIQKLWDEENCLPDNFVWLDEEEIACGGQYIYDIWED